MSAAPSATRTDTAPTTPPSLSATRMVAPPSAIASSHASSRMRTDSSLRNCAPSARPYAACQARTSTRAISAASVPSAARTTPGTLPLVRCTRPPVLVAWDRVKQDQPDDDGICGGDLPPLVGDVLTGCGL